jgi:hypothetical protein
MVSQSAPGGGTGEGTEESTELIRPRRLALAVTRVSSPVLRRPFLPYLTDHISPHQNLVSMGQLPITVGLFFSLGHSSIVVGVTIA